MKSWSSKNGEFTQTNPSALTGTTSLISIFLFELHIFFSAMLPNKIQSYCDSYEDNTHSHMYNSCFLVVYGGVHIFPLYKAH